MQSFADEPKMFRGFSELNQESKNDIFLDFFQEEQVFGKTKMEDEMGLW